MKNNLNYMILNDKDIGISKIELDRSNLRIIDKKNKYILQICIQYNWKDINELKNGEIKEIHFNEYILHENNEPALIWPNTCNVEKISDDYLCFNLEFNDLINETHYMNKRGCFDIQLNSLKVKIFINYKDALDSYIEYWF